MWHAHAQALAAATAAMGAGHVRLGPCLVDEDQALRVEIGLGFEPGAAPFQDVRAVLLKRVPGLFYA
jgi:hypothetical protein